MQPKKEERSIERNKDTAEVVGFFYRPVNKDNRPHRRVAKSSYKRQRTPEFAQINYRMVLKGNCNGMAYLNNSEQLVQWSDVFALECFSDDDDCCPICLMPFSIPRAIHCGHLFCYSCIMYYLRSQNEQWIKCPMCSELFDGASLRPVRLLPARSPLHEGSECSMDLIVRRRHCINGFPASLDHIYSYLQNPFLPADSPEEVVQFCHLLKYTPTYELALLQHQLKDCEMAEESMKSSCEELLLGALYIIREDLLRQYKAVLTFLQNNPLINEPLMNDDSILGDDLLFYYGYPTYFSYHLHQFTLKCLLSQYGSFSDLPPTISCSVIQIETMDSSDHSRVDATLLHLPSHAIIHYIEVDIRPLLHGRLDGRLWKEWKERENYRNHHQRVMKREERKIDIQVQKQEQTFFEQFAGYAEGAEEKPDTMSCMSFPTLPHGGIATNGSVSDVPRNAWKERSNGTIGVNLTLDRGIKNGLFPSLGQSSKKETDGPKQVVNQMTATMNWGKLVEKSPNLPSLSSNHGSKSKGKKKSVPLFSF